MNMAQGGMQMDGDGGGGDPSLRAASWLGVSAVQSRCNRSANRVAVVVAVAVAVVVSSSE